MESRSATLSLSINQKKVTKKIFKYCEGFTYTDPASGESDSLSLSLNDIDKKWLNGWFPHKNDILKAKIKTENWNKQGKNQTLDCGKFYLDQFSVQGAPTALTIGGVSSPKSEAFDNTKRNKTWKKTTVYLIVKRIAKKYKLKLVFEANKNIKIKEIEQSSSDDCSFINDLCEKYGIYIKIYNNKIIAFDREKYKKRKAKKTINKDEMLSWSYSDTLTGKYDCGKLTYTDSKKNKEVSVTYGKGKHKLVLQQEASDHADAKRQLIAAIKAANHGLKSLSFSVPGDVSIFATNNIQIKGLGKINGKYYIDKVTNSLGTSGFVTNVECSKV